MKNYLFLILFFLIGCSPDKEIKDSKEHLLDATIVSDYDLVDTYEINKELVYVHINSASFNNKHVTYRMRNTVANYPFSGFIVANLEKGKFVDSFSSPYSEGDFAGHEKFRIKIVDDVVYVPNIYEREDKGWNELKVKKIDVDKESLPIGGIDYDSVALSYDEGIEPFDEDSEHLVRTKVRAITQNTDKNTSGKDYSWLALNVVSFYDCFKKRNQEHLLGLYFVFDEFKNDKYYFKIKRMKIGDFNFDSDLYCSEYGKIEYLPYPYVDSHTGEIYIIRKVIADDLFYLRHINNKTEEKKYHYIVINKDGEENYMVFLKSSGSKVTGINNGYAYWTDRDSNEEINLYRHKLSNK